MQQVYGEEEEDPCESYSTVPVGSVNISLRHTVQQNNWDCGLSCVAMVLPAKKQSFFNRNKEEIIREEGIEFSTWTIDLAYLLKKFDVRFQYYTSTIGICPIYYQHQYYTTVLPNDESRVKKKFENAKRSGIIIHMKILSECSLIHHLSDHGPIIILTNANLLTCDICNKREKETKKTLMPISYQGHYVVLIGYSFLTNHIFYKNPSRKHGTCRMPFMQLDKARHSFGTDDDVLLIY